MASGFHMSFVAAQQISSTATKRQQPGRPGLDPDRTSIDMQVKSSVNLKPE
jgi:hypothetical protein